MVVVRFEVEDTGIGIIQEQQARLFESFTQADASTTRKYGGTGLGLTISKQLVELMRGEIGVRSEPGQGSTFLFTLPFEKQPDRDRAASYLTSLQGLRVLLLGASSTNRNLLDQQLACSGVHSESAKDDLEAFRMLKAAADRGEPYEVAILDIRMPSMKSISLARRIKADPATASTRLVLLTHKGQLGEVEEARRLGIEAYLTKPVRQSEIHDALAMVMRGPVEVSTPAKDAQLVTRHGLKEEEGARVLVVEDNAMNQKVTTEMVEKLGYRVDIAEDGSEALEALSRTTYAAVLMDCRMPKLDSYEATKEIRRRESPECHTPIIALTANAVHGDREKALEAGMDDYVSKPIKLEYLEALLRRWIPQPVAAATVFKEPTEDAAVPEDPADPLDHAVLARLRKLRPEGEPDILADLLELFLRDVPPQLAALRDAVEAEDAVYIERIAHPLKGSCGNLGARRMSGICVELQEAGGSGDLARASELLDCLEVEFDRVNRALGAQIERT